MKIKQKQLKSIENNYLNLIHLLKNIIVLFKKKVQKNSYHGLKFHFEGSNIEDNSFHNFNDALSFF